MALTVTRDNTIYLTVIYPFTLLIIDQFKIEDRVGNAERYLDWVDSLTRSAEKDIHKFTTVAEKIAERHIAGGAIGFPFQTQALAQDLWGRSGGLIHIGFNRIWKEARTDAEKANDIAIVGYDREPGKQDLKTLQTLKGRGVYLIGFGPKNHPSLEKIVAICDAWFDTKLGKDDRVLELESGARVGHGNVAANAIHGATLMAETIAALTRRDRMPTIWKSYSYDDGRAWGEKYFRRRQFHDDYQIAPIAAGALGRRFLNQIRYPIHRLRAQGNALRDAAKTIENEIAQKGKVYVVLARAYAADLYRKTGRCIVGRTDRAASHFSSLR